MTDSTQNKRSGPLRTRRATAFAVAFGLAMVLALNGGSYDIVARQETAMVVWAAIAIGIAFGVLPRGRPRSGPLVSLIAFAGLAGWATLAFTWTESDERTLEEVARVLAYAGFVVLAYLGLNRYTARAAAAGLGAAAMAVPALAVISRLAPEVITDDLVTRLGVDRLSYPFGYWNALACWAAMSIAFALAWSAHPRELWIRMAVLAVVPASGLALYLTYSRAGIIAAAVAVAAAVAFSRSRWTAAIHVLVAAAGSALAILVARNQPQIADATGDEGASAVALALLGGSLICALGALGTRALSIDGVRLPLRAARVTVAVAVAVSAVLALTVARGPIEEAWSEFRDERTTTRSADPSARLSSFGGTRYSVWSSTLDASASDRLRGIGPGSFEYWWARNGDEPEFLRDGHSLYLEVLAEYGLIGLLLLLIAIGAALTTAISALGSGLRSKDYGPLAGAVAAFAVFAVYSGVDWVWEMPALVYLGLGSIAVAGSAGFERWGRTRVPVWVRLVMVGLALIAAAVQVPGLVSTELLRGSAEQLRAGQSDDALALAEDAVSAEGFAASPYVQRGLVKQARGDLDGARSDLLEAIERERTSWRHHLVLAGVLARLGDRDGVSREIMRARELSPRSIYLAPGSPTVTRLLTLAEKG